MLPPAEEVAIAHSKLKRGDLGTPPRAMGSTTLRVTNKKQKMVQLHSGGFDDDDSMLY